jgi:hypothetical protein
VIGETDDDRSYPLPRVDHDPRFTVGVSIDVAGVLVKHGYPEITSGADLRELQQALFRFLYEPLTSGREVEAP